MDSMTDWINESVQQYTLENKRIEMSIRIDPEFKLDQDYARYMGQQIVRVMNEIAVRRLEKIEYKWPKDWKEAAKERFAPKWFKEKWPVVYEVKNHLIHVHYPDYDIKGNPHIVVVETNMPRIPVSSLNRNH